MNQPNMEHNPTRAIVEMPLGITVVERRYTPQHSSNEPAYKHDAAFFKTRKDRWIAIRKALPGEVDNGDTTFWLDGVTVIVPTAWMRVTRHPTLGFTAVMVWRGTLAGIDVDAQGYMELESDEAVDFTIGLMRNNGCANWDEVKGYMAKLERAKAIFNAQQAAHGSMKVH